MTDTTTAAALRVVKLDYSLDPWRLVNEEGRELYVWQEHPYEGVPPFQTPACYRTKREAVAALAALAAMQAKERKERG